MIVECSFDGGVRLTDPFDFRRFKLVLKGKTDTAFLSAKRITFVDAENALVPIDLVPSLPGRPPGEAWERDYTEMVAKAREHGWIDASANAIRAHVKREC